MCKRFYLVDITDPVRFELFFVFFFTDIYNALYNFIKIILFNYLLIFIIY